MTAVTSTPASTRTETSDPYCLGPETAAGLLADAPWHRFAVIGDDPAAGWADRVADVLRRVHPDLEYLNLAEVGATTERTLKTQADALVAFGPDLVHVSSGANDLLHPDPDFAAIERSLRRMFELAAGTGAQLTTSTLGRAFAGPAFEDRDARIRSVDVITRELARSHGAVLADMRDHPGNGTTSGQAAMASEVVIGLAHLLAGREGGL
jgi:hypothetical protein